MIKKVGIHSFPG